MTNHDNDFVDKLVGWAVVFLFSVFHQHGDPSQAGVRCNAFLSAKLTIIDYDMVSRDAQKLTQSVASCMMCTHSTWNCSDRTIQYVLLAHIRVLSVYCLHIWVKINRFRFTNIASIYKRIDSRAYITEHKSNIYQLCVHSVSRCDVFLKNKQLIFLSRFHLTNHTVFLCKTPGMVLNMNVHLLHQRIALTYYLRHRTLKFSEKPASPMISNARASIISCQSTSKDSERASVDFFRSIVLNLQCRTSQVAK